MAVLREDMESYLTATSKLSALMDDMGLWATARKMQARAYSLILLEENIRRLEI